MKPSAGEDSSARHESRRSLVVLALVLALTSAVYWPGLSGDLVLDDGPTLEPIVRLAEGELSWHEALTQHDNFRPVSMASFVVNWMTTGDRVWPLKFTNLVVHLMCGVLVFLLTNRLLAQPAASMDRGRRWLAVWVATCWLLAPLLVSTVLYVSQRMAALSALFSLAALFAYLCGRERIGEDRARGLGLIALGLAVFWPLAIASKENGILVPALIVVVELFFFSGARRAEGKLLANRILALSVTVALLVGVAIILAAPAAIFFSYEYRPFTLWQRLMTEWRILFDYLGNLLLLPWASPFGIYHDDYPLSHGLLDPVSTLLAALAWLAVLVAGCFARGTRMGMVAFGLWFYLAAHLVESTLIPLELYFEHRNYLPSVGIFFSLGYSAYLLLARARFKRAVAAALILVPICYGLVTYQRVLIWQSWGRMLFAALSHYPDSIRVHTGLANLYLGQGKLNEALQHLERAAAHPDASELGLALHTINAYCLAGRPAPPSAYDRLERSPAGDDFYAINVLAWLANAVDRHACNTLDLARLAQALDSATLAQQGAGSHGKAWLLHTHTARILAAAGNKRAALVHLDRASGLEPFHPEPGLLAVGYRLDLGELSQAKKTLLALKQKDSGRVASQSRRIKALERRLERIEARHQPVQ